MLSVDSDADDYYSSNEIIALPMISRGAGRHAGVEKNARSTGRAFCIDFSTKGADYSFEVSADSGFEPEVSADSGLVELELEPEVDELVVPPDNAVLSVPAPVLSTPVSAPSGVLAAALLSVDAPELSVLVTVGTRPVVVELPLTAALTVEITGASGVAAVPLLSAEVTAGTIPTDVALLMAFVSADAGFEPPEAELSALVIDVIGLDEPPRLVTELSAPVSADVGLDEPVLALLLVAGLLIRVALRVLVTELTALVSGAIGVLDAPELSAEPIVLTAEVTGASALELLTLPPSVELSVLAPELSALVSGASGVLAVALLSAEAPELRPLVTAGTTPVDTLPPVSAELSVLVTVLTVLVTGASGVLAVALLSVEPTELTVLVMVSPTPWVVELPTMAVLSVLVSVLRPPPSGDSGVVEVLPAKVEPIELTADVTAPSTPGFEEPLDEDPLDEDPLDEEPLDEEPLDEEPLDEEPLDEEPLDEEPLDEEPLDEEPLDEDPLDEEPLDEEPLDEEPLDEEPLDEEPLDEEPLDEEPLDEEPLDEAPLDEEPLDEEPLDEEPLDEEPLDEEPLDEAPLDEAPLDEAPLDEAPLDEAPPPPPDELLTDPEPLPPGGETRSPPHPLRVSSAETAIAMADLLRVPISLSLNYSFEVSADSGFEPEVSADSGLVELELEPEVDELVVPPPDNAVLSVPAPVLSTPVSAPSGVLAAALLSVDAPVLSVLVTVGTRPVVVELPLTAALTVEITGASGVAAVPLLSAEVTAGTMPTDVALPMAFVSTDAGFEPPEAELSALVIDEIGLDEPPRLVTELSAPVSADVGLDEPLPALLPVAGLLIRVALRVLVIVLTALVTGAIGVLDAPELSAEPTVLTAEVTGASALELVALPPSAELNVAAPELSAPVTDDSGVLAAALFSVEAPALRPLVTAGTTPVVISPPLSAELRVLVTVLAVLVTGASGVFAVALLSVEAPELSPLVMMLVEASAVLSVPAPELRALPSGASGVDEVLAAAVEPSELTADVTAPTMPGVAPDDEAPLDEPLDEEPLEEEPLDDEPLEDEELPDELPEELPDEEPLDEPLDDEAPLDDEVPPELVPPDELFETAPLPLPPGGLTRLPPQAASVSKADTASAMEVCL